MENNITRYGFADGYGVDEYISELKNKNFEGIYRDPDGTWSDINSDFYIKIEKFLNKQEKRFLNGNWRYKFNHSEPGGINVYDNGNILFTLRSDQFGFSRPVKGKNYPYNRFLILSQDYNLACEKVGSWINDTRTIGGSFLWPIRLCYDGIYRSEYNRDRGGQVNTGISYYIQDRVDLTLLEIKHSYDPNYEKKYSGDKLFRYYIDDTNYDEYECSHIKMWLDHFGSFYNYVDFFMLWDFVDKETLQVINITDGTKLDDNQERIPFLTNDVSVDYLENMLYRLSKYVLNRSENMWKEIQKHEEASEMTMSSDKPS